MKYNVVLLLMFISAAIIPNHVHSMEPEVNQLPASQLSDDKNVNNENSIDPSIFQLNLVHFDLCEDDAASKEYGLILENPNIDPDVEELLADQILGDMFEKKYKESFKKIFMKEQLPHETLVSFWEKNSIKMQPTNTIPLTLATNTKEEMVTILLIQYNNKEQYAGMTHYPSLSLLQHYTEIKNLCAEIYSTHTEKQQITAINFFVSMPLTSLQEDNDTSYLELQDVVNEKLGKISPIKTYLIPYVKNDRHLFPLSNNERDFEVILHPDKATVISRNGNKRIELPLIK